MKSKPAKTVIFGPFVGEFGWELLFWQGWVKLQCRTRYKDYYKIASSYPGRQPFYPDVNEFISLPEEIVKLKISARNYICDGWLHGYPGTPLKYSWRAKALIRQILARKRPHRVAVEEKWNGVDVSLSVLDFENQLLEKFSIDSEVEIIAPWRVNKIGGLTFGWHQPKDPKLFSLPSNILQIPFRSQLLEKVQSLPTGVENPYLKENERFVAVFPRKRGFRRQDKNWNEQNYLDLIQNLQHQGYKVGILGDKSGAYFVGNPPMGVVDLVNIQDSQRLNTHLEFLQACYMAVGAMSGATLMSLAAGVPTVIFGHAEEQMRYHYENYLKTPLHYLANMNPKVDDLISGVDDLGKYIEWAAKNRLK